MGAFVGIRGLILAACLTASPVLAAPPEVVIADWYRLMLELVRHTATYSPPVASRSFAYVGITIHEAQASGNPALVSLSGQLTDMPPMPARPAGALDEGAVLQGALGAVIPALFHNTGPTGQRALAAMGRRLDAAAVDGLDPAVAALSLNYGRQVAAAVLAWGAADGGESVQNLGFPTEYRLGGRPESWVPTSTIALQQAPLLPEWGKVRPFALTAGDACALPPPPAYSEDPASAFYREAHEVLEVSRDLTAQQEEIARFWADDPMLSSAPPGHWIAITMTAIAAEGLGADRQGEVLARLGIALADAFIVCWRDKYHHDLIRPVTYIQRVIDPAFQPLLITPPFPEYPSGHSAQSGAAAEVLTALFGEPYAFHDETHVDDGLEGRAYDSFWQAAEEAGMSRLYGGIHFRSAIERGLVQGRCVGEQVKRLRTRQ